MLPSRLRKIKSVILPEKAHIGMPNDLEIQFHEQMLSVYRSALTKAHYKATVFLRMVTEHGGLEAARRLLATPYLPDGFAELWQRGYLNLTMEAVVIQQPWCTLFTEAELATAN